MEKASGDSVPSVAYIIEPMRLRDIPEVMEIERASFPMPWSPHSYRYEILQNDRSHYYVLRPRLAEQRGGWWEKVQRALGWGRRGPVLGYGGFWLVAGEAHISTIAVHPEWRGRGLGELLLAHMLEQATALGAETATLEVRVSNQRAQNLYRKYGFQVVGCRRCYYRDNDEDALIMTTPPLTQASYQARIQQLRRQLWKRLAQSGEQA